MHYYVVDIVPSTLYKLIPGNALQSLQEHSKR